MDFSLNFSLSMANSSLAWYHFAVRTVYIRKQMNQFCPHQVLLLLVTSHMYHLGESQVLTVQGLWTILSISGRHIGISVSPRFVDHTFN